VRFTVAVSFSGFGSGVTSVAVPVSVMTLPDGTVTFTVNRSVHVVFGAIALFSLQAISPLPPRPGWQDRANRQQHATPGITEVAVMYVTRTGPKT